MPSLQSDPLPTLGKNTMPNILLVEDDPTLTMFYRKGLVDNGYEVTNVSSCQKAIDTLMREDIKLVLLDMNLPDGSGEQVLDYIESEPALMEIPVIILTGFTRYTYQGSRATVSQVITKPVTAATIVKEVKVALT